MDAWIIIIKGFDWDKECKPSDLNWKVLDPNRSQKRQWFVR